MSAGLPSDEVADDYKNSLEDLVTNDRYQIGNLTVIAKENIEHGEAIARVLENHIQRAPPARKLPAIYVLDSIVKNVGTPYTVYFGRNLYNTFMNAYTLVDGNVRKKLDETLKTWREPVPGSLSTTPVFRLDITQRIVDALSKARLAAQQSRSQHRVPVDPRMAITQTQPFRSTPTPPQTLLNYRGPSHATQVQPPSRNGFTAPYTNPHNSQPAQPQYPAPAQPAPTYQNPQYAASPPNSVDLGTLYRDIDDLIVDAKIDCASHPMDATARTKLSSLQSLKNIVETGKLSEKDLQDVRASVSEQMTQRVIPPRPTPPPFSTPTPISSTTLPYSMPMTTTQPLPQSAPPFINSNSLAELIRATANRNQPTPPPPLSSLPFQPQLTNTPPTHNVTPAPSIAEIPLIAQLRASGLLPATPTPPPGLSTQPIAASISTPSTKLNTQNGYLPPNFIDVQFTSASIRIHRPQLITSLFSTRPNTCNTCGCRFTSDDLGKEQKAKHLDWHFKTKSRMADAEKKGQSRSWYVDEREWISSKEYADGTGPEETTGDRSGLLSTSSTGKAKMPDFVRAPSDPHLKSLPCPIDLEPFVSFWSDELQEFIWTDAIQIGDRIYHASCYRQAIADRAKAATPIGTGGSGRIGTPDSVLGKRKADIWEAVNGIATKIKVDSRIETNGTISSFSK